MKSGLNKRVKNEKHGTHRCTSAFRTSSCNSHGNRTYPLSTAYHILPTTVQLSNECQWYQWPHAIVGRPTSGRHISATSPGCKLLEAEPGKNAKHLQSTLRLQSTTSSKNPTPFITRHELIEQATDRIKYTIWVRQTFIMSRIHGIYTLWITWRILNIF